MKRFLTHLAAALCTWAATASVTAAPVLQLHRVSPAQVLVGSAVEFELQVYGLDAPLAAFSADIGYDAAVLGFLPAASLAQQFGTRLGDPLLEAFGAALETAPGLLHLDLVSLLDLATLDTLQRDAAGNRLSGFVLADLVFQAIGPGTVLLDFWPAATVLSDASGTAWAGVQTNGSGVVAVPEPGSLALVVLAMLAARSARARTPG